MRTMIAASLALSCLIGVSVIAKPSGANEWRVVSTADAVLVVPATALANGAFGDRIGVIDASPAEELLREIFGGASDIADIAAFDDLGAAKAALASGRIDSFYGLRDQASALIGASSSDLATFEPFGLDSDAVVAARFAAEQGIAQGRLIRLCAIV